MYRVARLSQHGMWPFPYCPLVLKGLEGVVEDRDVPGGHMARSDLLQHHFEGDPWMLNMLEMHRNAMESWLQPRLWPCHEREL